MYCRVSRSYTVLHFTATFHLLGARFKEGCNINRSLFVLGQVIKKLTDEGQK